MPERPIVFVTRRVPEAALTPLAEYTDFSVWEDELPPPRSVLMEAAARCHGLITLLTDRIDGELMQAAPHLAVVSNVAVGYDNIDVEAATSHGIVVTNTPGVLTETTADFAFALLLAAARRVVEADRFTRKGRWRTWHPLAFLGSDVHGATLGIIGMGQIGIAVARRARGFGMRVLYYSRTRRPQVERLHHVQYADLPQLLAESDFVSLHVPLNGETRHMIDEQALARMKPSAILINTARGPVVDQAALYRALRDRRIAAAAIDVTDPEPIAADDPLLSLDNLVITPHIASASEATRTRMAAMAVENLLAVFHGKRPRNLVNADVWRRRRWKRSETRVRVL